MFRRRAALELFYELFGELQVYLRAKLSEGVRREPEVLARVVALRGGGECTPEEEVRARCSVAVAEHLEDGEASAEVVRGARGVGLREREQPVQSLRLARDGEVGGRRVGLFRDAREKSGAFVHLAAR